MAAERKQVDVLNGIRTDIVRSVRSADSYLFILEKGLAELLAKPDGQQTVLEIVQQARGFLAEVTD